MSKKKKHIPSKRKELPHLSKGTKIIFTTAMILLPLVFFMLLELILRIFHYGSNLDLILTKKINDTSYCFLNKKVARRFFFQQDIYVPDARTAVFKKEKSSDTYRIFCLGGSTTAGFPYEFNATFPSLLKDRLDVLFPQKSIEVINVGISAINSYSVLDFTRELVDYNPDLFLIYMGHNEFYGALGIGSTQRIGKNRDWVLFYLKLQKVRLFNLVRDGIGKIGGLFKDTQLKQLHNQTLMGQAVKDKYIGLDSREYLIAQNYFEKNYQDIIRTAQKGNAKVIISTLICNLADQAPFSQQFSEKINDLQKSLWQEYFNAGYQFEMSGKSEKALAQYDKAERIDPSPAMLHFQRARCLQAMGKANQAREAYVTAKDYDMLRFRASSDFNNIIRKISMRNQIPLIEMEKVFAPFCQDSILDRNLFSDHLHPNFQGYFLMAKAFTTAMAAADCIMPEENWNWLLDKTDDEYRRLAGVTDLDLEIANQRIQILTSHWPFNHKIILRKNSGSEYDNLLQKTVQELLVRQLGWNEAHYRIAQYLQKNGQYDRAAQEYEAVIKVTPTNYYPYLELGDLLMWQREFSKAEEILKKGLVYSQQLPFAYAKLGLLYFFTQRPDLAVTQLNRAIAIDRRVNRFNADELAGAYYIMSMAYGQSGNFELAKAAAQNALKIKPNYPEAAAVIEKINATLKIK